MNPLHLVFRWYERRLFPCLMDRVMARPYFEERRRELLHGAAGLVCEVGVGTGRNCACMPPATVRLVGLDPNPGMKGSARKRLAGVPFPAWLVRAPGEAIPCPSRIFDAVVCTYTLCSVEDPAAVLAEVRRVLMPTGRLYLLEHGLHPAPRVQRWQHRIEPFHGVFAGGCRLTRDPSGLAEAAGFCFERLRRFQSPFGRLAGYMTLGVARPR